MSDIKFGSKQHINNLIQILELNIKKDIGRRWDPRAWDECQRVCGMSEAILCLYKPDEFAPGKKFKFQTITTVRKTLFGKLKQETRREAYVNMLLRNLKDCLNISCFALQEFFES